MMKLGWPQGRIQGWGVCNLPAYSQNAFICRADQHVLPTDAASHTYLRMAVLYACLSGYGPGICENFVAEISSPNCKIFVHCLPMIILQDTNHQTTAYAGSVKVDKI